MNGFESLYGGFESPRVNFKQKLRIEVESALQKKKSIFVHVLDFFGLGLFLTKMKIKSKSFLK